MNNSTEASISRRQWLQQTGLACGLSTLALSHSTNAAEPLPGWVDAHSHIWTRDITRFPLNPKAKLDDLDPPSFTAEELLDVAGKSGVTQVVLIQHYPYHGWDNSYLLDAVKRYPKQFRAVGMIDHALPEVSKRMKDLLAQGVTGFRITPGADPEHWLEQEGMQSMWRTAADTRQRICCLINPIQLPQLDAMCRQHPETPLVIDHFARIGIDGQLRGEEIKALCQLAKHRGVRVKASAYYALGQKKPPYTDLIPMLRQVLDAFGHERVMWASDAPYQLQNGNSYDASVRLVTDHLDFLSKDERDGLLRQTALDTFFWS